jgi:hypothetical protein
MGQMYLQRFANRDGISKSALDQAWEEAFKAFAQTGNWGGVDGGVTPTRRMALDGAALC